MTTHGTTLKEGQFGAFAGAVVSQLWQAVKTADADQIQHLIDNQSELQNVLHIAFINGEASSESSILTRLYEDEEVVIPATTGKRTFATAKNVFTGYLDFNFKNWGMDTSGEATLPTPVEVHEVRQDATFREIFIPLGNPDDITLTQEQVIAFCETHSVKLPQDGYATLFLFRVGNEIFVAYVHALDSRLKADVGRFGDDCFWRAEYCRRVVVPQL